MKTNNYLDLVSEAMVSDKKALHWFEYLKKVQNKQEHIRGILTRERPKHPGLTNAEILNSYGGQE